MTLDLTIYNVAKFGAKTLNKNLEMDAEEYCRAYQEIKFQENECDCFSVAATKRKIMLLDYYGSMQLKESNQVTQFLLNENLKSYAKIVDNKNPGSVNNYADYVMTFLSNYQNDDRKNWKSNLDSFILKEHVQPLSCSKSINCKCSDQLKREDIEDLKNAFLKYEEKNNSVPPEKLTKLMPERKSIETQAPAVAIKNKLNPIKKFEQSNAPFAKAQDSKNEESQNAFSAFRTARDELQIQNLKKFGKSGNSTNEKNYSYGTTKKSLGTRKGGVFGKFQPPVRSKEVKEEMQNPAIMMEVDEVVDERLKNIDPAMIEIIKNEIMDHGSNVTWNDIAGLHLAKNTIQEIVVWPMLRPDIFTGLRRPPKGILLFGPPGTGKTLIGKCIASQSNSTFFSISASSLTSKWVGDGEKMVRTLFAVAKVHQPSVVFIDEIDSLLSQRSDTEHESSRRIKTEFLVQLDGAGTGEEDRILIIGATNRPQELDEAARRRLVKRLYIPLPDEEARKQIIQNLISSERHCLTEADIEKIARLTRGYSGADVKNLCQEASLGPIRSISPAMISSINPDDVRPLNSNDFESALSRIKSSVSESDLDIYVAWDRQYGCGSGCQ